MAMCMVVSLPNHVPDGHVVNTAMCALLTAMTVSVMRHHIATQLRSCCKLNQWLNIKFLLLHQTEQSEIKSLRLQRRHARLECLHYCKTVELEPCHACVRWPKFAPAFTHNWLDSYPSHTHTHTHTSHIVC